MVKDVGVCETLVVEQSILNLVVCFILGEVPDISNGQGWVWGQFLIVEGSLGIPANLKTRLVADREA
jgi:hypothetical protein